MEFGLLLLLVLVSTVYTYKTPPNEDFYVAAVVEFSPINGSDSIMANAKDYVSIIQEIGKKADIIVFPEVGLFLYDHYTTFIKVPSPDDSVAPADDKDAHPALQIISKEAREQNVYITINVHEEFTSLNKTYYYNTNLIFNRTGHVIGRYRKFNLFAEPLNVTREPELVYFDSDFGVRFGTFICFDILFEKPALELVWKHNVTDILYPTFWYSGLPFFTAVQTQAGWAYALDVNLLASGGNKVHTSNTGSGVYAGKKGPVVYLQAQRDQTTVLMAKVVKKGREGTPEGSISKKVRPGPLERLMLWDDPVISKLNSFLITPQSYNLSTFNVQLDLKGSSGSLVSQDRLIEETLCQGKFCCSFLMNMTVFFRVGDSSLSNASSNPYQYRLAVFDGITKYNIEDAGVQLCAVISCLNDSVESCGKPTDSKTLPLTLETKKFGNISLYSTVFHNIVIKTDTLDKETFLMPSLLELSTDPEVYGSLMSVTQFSMNTNGTFADITFFSDKLITGGIYGRVFSRDGKSSGNMLSYFSPTLLVIITSITFYLFYQKL